MAQCEGVRQATGEYLCGACRARWDPGEDAPECCAVPAWANPLASSFERRMAARKAAVPERLTVVCDDLRNARAPERLIRQIEDCIIELRAGSA